MLFATKEALAASRMLQSVMSSSEGVAPPGCQPVGVLHWSSITFTLTMVVAVLSSVVSLVVPMSSVAVMV